MKIEIKGLTKLIKISEKFPKIAEKHVKTAIGNSLLKIERQAKINAPVGSTSNLRNNWVLNIGRFQGSLSSGAKSNGEFYGPHVEMGTRPHYVPAGSYGFNLWARNRGLNPYAVANSIKKKGTKANPFFQKSVDESSNYIDSVFQKAIDDILKEI